MPWPLCGCGIMLFSDIITSASLKAMGIRLAVGQQTLNLLGKVRILDPQPNIPHGAFV
jgi:hypothetical protein